MAPKLAPFLTDDSQWSYCVPAFNDPEIYRSVLEHMRIGVYLVDPEQRIQFWNEGAERLTGYLRQDVLGHFCRDFLSPPQQDGTDGLCELGGALAAVLRDGRPVITELSLRHKAGHQVALRVRSVPIRNRDGMIVGAAESFDESHKNANAERRHEKLANYGCLDEATGVLTRSFIETHLRESLMTFSAHRIPFSILLIEVDGIPHFRETYGPSAIASVLRVAAKTIENSIRPMDFLGHYTQNQFLCLLSECSAVEVKNAAGRLLRMIKNSKLKWWGDTVSLTASFGGTSARDGDTEKSIMERVEKALAASMAEGGNRLTVAD
jgi:diguanylate cyclase (GGDEF)-like protein/PAS domain S-box-containing protein